MTHFKDIKWLPVIDKAIFVFVIIFLLSLSNSIFVNQLGYFGALVLILIRFAVARENPFSKSGLEFAFIWFILAEIISTYFSADQPHALNNLIKRVLLIPVVYTMIAAVKNEKQGRTYFYVYLAGSLITVIVYLFFAYEHFTKDLYGIQQSGPSIFQYPITASEIISFTVIFLFAFFINERYSWWKRGLYLFGFLLSSAALIATYKRTGWLGAAFGIFIILLVRKQYKTLAVCTIGLIALIVIEKDISRVEVFSFENNKLKKEYSIDTDGKAADISFAGDMNIVSDYDEGLVHYDGTQKVQRIKTIAPVNSFKYWTKNIYVANHSDTRFSLIKVDDENIKVGSNFISPGLTINYAVHDNKLLVLDSDSGLTIYTNPEDPTLFYRQPEFAGYQFLQTDKKQVFVASADSGFRILEFNSAKHSYKTVVTSYEKAIYYYKTDSLVYLSNSSGLKILNISNGRVTLKDSTDRVKDVYRAFTFENFVGFVKYGGSVVLTKFEYGNFVIKEAGSFDFTPTAFNIKENKIFVSNLKPSRFLSIFDPNNSSNQSRFALWRAGIRIIEDYPWFGVGDIDLAEFYKEYKRPFDKEILGHMHNNFIHVFVTLGLFGFLAVCFIFFMIIKIDLRIYRESYSSQFASSYALGAVGAFCGFLFSGLTELNFWDHEITTLIWFVFGLNIAVFNSIRPKELINVK